MTDWIIAWAASVIMVGCVVYAFINMKVQNRKIDDTNIRVDSIEKQVNRNTLELNTLLSGDKRITVQRTTKVDIGPNTHVVREGPKVGVQL